MVAALPSSGWQAFERLQHSVQKNKRVDAAAFADEEALTDLLDDFAPSEPSADQVGRRYYSLRLNRRRKHRARGRLWAAHSVEASRRDATEKSVDPSKKAEQVDLLTVIEPKIIPSEWVVLRNLASGMTYERIATDLRVSAGKLRTQIFRLRVAMRAVA